MAKIPLYDNTVIAPRAVPNLVDEGAIGRAAMGFEGIAKAANQLSTMADKHAAAAETTAVNASLIDGERRKIEASEAARQQASGKPEGFAKSFNVGLEKIDEDVMQSLPTEAAKSAYKQSAATRNLSHFESNLQWENRRRTEVYAETLDQSAANLNIMAMRAGREGGNIDQLLNDADASTVAGATFLAPDEVRKLNRKMRQGIVDNWIRGIIERSPSEAKAILESRKYDSDLGADGLEKAYRAIDYKQKQLEAQAVAAENKRLNEELKLIKDRSDDPITYGIKTGLVPAEPLDFNNTANLASQLSQRATLAKAMQQQHGTSLAVFTKDEATILATSIAKSSPDQQMVLFKTLRDGVTDPDAYQMAVQQIRPDSPVTALAGAMIGLDGSVVTKSDIFKPDETATPTKAARYMLQGEALLNPAKATKASNGTGKSMPMPPDKDLRGVFDETVNDAFRGRPNSADTAYQSTRAIYAALAAEKGNFSGEFDSDLGDKAVKMALGGVVKINNKNVIPPYGMDATRFVNLIKINFDNAIKDNGLDPKITRWGDVQLENASGYGRYYVQIGAGYLLDKNSQPVVIDLMAKAKVDKTSINPLSGGL